MATERRPALSCDPTTPWWDREVDKQLLCVDVRDETHDVKTFSFRAAEPRLFSFTAGQYMIFELDIEGENVSRCYSLSSSPLRPSTVSITVKRVTGGRVSNWLHEHLRPGQVVAVRGPAGQFTLPTAGPGSELAGPYLFASGGSGITPLMSMARALADARHHPDIVFLHASRTPADVIFQDELRQIAKVTPGFRLLLLPESLAGSPDFPGMTGRVSEEFFKLAVPDMAKRTVMCCGPAPFMSAVRRCATALGVPPERYAEESFDASALNESKANTMADSKGEASVGAHHTSPALANTAPVAEPVRTFQVTFAKQSRVMPVEATQTVLAAARKAGISLPSSCASGLCGTCKTKLVSGQVDMKHAGGLRQREIDAGFFLPCCSKPLSDLVLER